MEIDGEVMKFYHMSFNGDIPNTRKIMYEALDKMETKGDWDNLPHLLEGLHYYANRKLQHYDYPKLTRKAGAKGCIYTIIECARQVRKTGFRLDASEKVNEIMMWVQLKAIDSGWDQRQTEQALRWAEMVLEMLETEDHQPKKRKGTKDDGKFPLHRDPQVLASPLHLAAQLAVKYQGGKDVGGKVAKYAKDLVALWPAGKGLLELHPVEAYADREGMRYLLEENEFLFMASPILRAVELTKGIVDPTVAKGLESTRAALADEIDIALAKKAGLAGRGVEMYKKLFGLVGA
jgi:hypothetical protein